MITREKVEGRDATVSYLRGDDWEPCKPAQATFIKIVFDDGEVRFAQALDAPARY